MKKIISIMLSVSLILSVLTVASFAEKKSYIFFECVSAEGQELVVDLCIKDTADLGIAGFGFYITFPGISMTGYEFHESVGTPTYYDIMGEPSDKPFIISGLPLQILWTSANGAVGRDKVALARFTFRTPEDVNGSDVKITLGIDVENLPVDSAGNVIDTRLSYIGVDIVGGVIAELPVMDPVAGDANGDDKVSLADAALMLQYIAEWMVGLDVENADVNVDGEVTLTDVSMTLKYIAGWDIALGVSQ